MIEITVNCNDDTITVEAPEYSKVLEIKEPYKLSLLLDDIFNQIDIGFNGQHISLDVKLNRIDEDTNVTVNEW